MRVRWALALLLGPLPLAAQSVAYEGGLSLTTGRYFFDTRTTSVALFSGLALTAGRFTLRATVPLLAQNTELVTQSSLGGMPSGGPISGMVSDSGRRAGRRGGTRMTVPATAVPGYAAALGDPTAMLTARVFDGPRAALTAGLGVKAPLADTARSTPATGTWGTFPPSTSAIRYSARFRSATCSRDGAPRSRSQRGRRRCAATKLRSRWARRSIDSRRGCYGASRRRWDSPRPCRICRSARAGACRSDHRSGASPPPAARSR
jgi:hypothetical protein